jgi:hypothetical protein
MLRVMMVIAGKIVDHVTVGKVQITVAIKS